MITGRIDQIAFGNRKQTNKHTEGVERIHH